jgi:hypothetical protein
VKVEYIGLKAKKIDNVAGTGIIWEGRGDVQDVPDTAWHALRQHPEIWRLADEADAQRTADAAASARFVIETSPGQFTTLDDMGHDELLGFAERFGIRVDKRLKDTGKIRAYIFSVAGIEAAPAAEA